ncbi:MAG: hypothetical protein R3A45_10060 [Bdellovibrionota bacterium]
MGLNPVQNLYAQEISVEFHEPAKLTQTQKGYLQSLVRLLQLGQANQVKKVTFTRQSKIALDDAKVLDAFVMRTQQFIKQEEGHWTVAFSDASLAQLPQSIEKQQPIDFDTEFAFLGSLLKGKTGSTYLHHHR